MEKRLRKGYTTGTYASAVAKAAAVFLLDKKEPGKVKVHLGNGREAEFIPLRVKLSELPEKLRSQGEPCLWWRIQKDAGDDPDVTDGVWVYGAVFPISDSRWEKLCREGKGYRSEKYPLLYLQGGPGIGIVSKPGLSCPVDHYAINPVPRAMIFEAVESVRRQAGYEGKLVSCIAVPEGVKLAEKTFNPHLGILGGISVLGTTGVVEPMSEQALVETIRLDIRVKAAAKSPVLIMSPGNYGEEFLREAMGVPLGEAVKCSNFIADSAEMAAEEGWKKLLLAGHVGKLIKVAGGVRNTHSQYGDGRMEYLEILTREVLKDRESFTGESLGKRERERLLTQIRHANTTEEAVGYLKEVHLAGPVLCHVARQVKNQINQWTGGRLETEVVVFSSFQGAAGKTENAEQFIRLWREKP